MSSTGLKRSQKFCPQCNEKNPIRSFRCKNCNFDFPRKNIPDKQTNTLEQYLARKTYPNRTDEIVVAVPVPQKQEKSIKEILENTKNNEEPINYEISNNFIFISNNNEQVEIIKQDADNLKINYPSCSFCTLYSFDCVYSFKTIYSSNLFLSNDNKLYLSLISLEQLTPKETILYQYKQETEEEMSYFSIKSKLVHCQENYSFFYIMIIVNNIAYCLLPIINENNENNDNIQINNNKLKEVFIIKKNFPICQIDSIYDEKEKLIKTILSDSNNQIFYYCFHKKKGAKPELLGVYENHFQSKITDLKFLSHGMISYFAACSRDGLLKIIDTNNSVVFKHKTYQTWITQLDFDNTHDIIYFLANFDDKVVGIKLNSKREPILKRLADTNHPYCVQVSEIGDKIYYLDDKGKLYSMTTSLIEELFRKKGKKEDDGPKLIYEIPNEDKNIFTSKFKLLNLYDKNGLCPILISLYRTHIQFLHLNSST